MATKRFLNAVTVLAAFAVALASLPAHAESKLDRETLEALRTHGPLVNMGEYKSARMAEYKVIRVENMAHLSADNFSKLIPASDGAEDPQPEPRH